MTSAATPPGPSERYRNRTKRDADNSTLVMSAHGKIRGGPAALGLPELNGGIASYQFESLMLRESNSEMRRHVVLIFYGIRVPFLGIK